MKELYDIFKQSAAVSIDTRSIQKGDLFFCLKGDRFDGNKFAKQALTAGASCVVLDNPECYTDRESMILVDDSLKTLQELATYHRQQLRIPIIGITGTNGKTTTKELIAAVLSTHFQCLSTNGNFNNHIGVPLTLLRIKEEHEMAVIEMGANHVGEIDALCEIAKPNLGIITNIGRAHLEGFGSFENIIETKVALYQAVEKAGGMLMVNSDDELLMEKSNAIRRETYGAFSKAKVKVDLEISSGSLHLVWEGKFIHTKLFGDYNLYNVAAAIAFGVHFNVPEKHIIQALEQYTPSNNRSQFEKGIHNELILDAYNANPDSVQNALAFFGKDRTEKKALILGDMLELGEYEDAEHKAVLEAVQQLDIDRVFIVGPIFYRQKIGFPDFLFFKDNMEALAYFTKNKLKNYRILLKGSRGIRLEVLKDELL